MHRYGHVTADTMGLVTDDAPRIAERLALSRVSTRLLGKAADPVCVGRYRLETRLGAGAHGVVFRAIDPRLGRTIAIKLLLRRRASTASLEDARRRLRREAQAIAALSHPGIVTVYDVGRYQEASGEEGLFLAMELVRGRSLRQWLMAGDDAHRPATIVDVFAQAARGLAAAHRQGVIHRDFKPDNVMVGDDRRVKVLDFGLARVWDEIDSVPTSSGWVSPIDPDLTATGMVMGTPVYMAPEQHRGETLTPAADQFSFCVSLYEALLGTRPFGGSSLEVLAEAKHHGPPPMPRDADVPRWLSSIVRRGLEPNPADRWPSMQALADALDRGPRGRWRSLRPALGLGLLAVVGLGASLAGAEDACEAGRVRTVWGDEPRRALQRSLGASDSPYAGAAVVRIEELMDQFAAEWGGVRRSVCEAEPGPERSRRITCLDRRLARVGTSLRILSEQDAPAPAQAVEVMVAAVAPLGCEEEGEPARWQDGPELEGFAAELDETAILQNAGQYTRAIRLARRLLRRPEARRTGPKVALQVRLGELYGIVDETPAAIELLSEAYFSAESADLPELVFEAALRLAMIHGDRLEQPAQSKQWLRHAEAAAGRLGDDPHREAALWQARSAVASAEGRFDDAIDAERTALQLRREVLEDDDFDLAVSYNNLAGALAAAGRYDEAVEFTEASLVVWRSNLGPTHPNVAISEDNLGIMLSQTGRYAEAIEHHERALEAALASIGPIHAMTANAHTNYGIALGYRGRHVEAIEQLQEAAEIYRQTVGDDHADLGRAFINLGMVRGLAGDHAGALRESLRARTVLERALGPEHPMVWAVGVNTADELRALGRYAEGLEVLEPTLPRLEEAFGPTHPYLAHGLTSEGRSWLGLRDAERAMPSLTRALEIWEAQPTDPVYEAETRFALAQALDGMGQAGPGQEQARRSRELYQEHEGDHAEEIERIDAWLRREPEPLAVTP